MSEARDRILAGVRSSLRRARVDPNPAAGLRAHIAAHRRNPIPTRAASLNHRTQVDLFVTMAEEVQASIARVSSPAAVPEAVARYLAAENLPAKLVIAPDPSLDAVPWESWPMLRIRRGRAEASDQVSFTGCHTAVAETGSLMLVSGPQSPTTLSFLPDTHIVLVYADQVVSSYEDGWDRLRRWDTSEILPRTVNFISGPSRTADIEQHIELGAHGPRRLHIVLVDDSQTSESEDGKPHNADG